MKRKFLSLVFSLLLLLSIPSFATNGVNLDAARISNIYVGTGTFNENPGTPAALKFDIAGYIYYTANYSTQLNLFSLSQLITNDSSSESYVDSVRYYAGDAQSIYMHTFTWALPENCAPGETVRNECVWEDAMTNSFPPVSNPTTIYTKNPYVMLKIKAGSGGAEYGLLAGWDIWLYDDYMEKEFLW